MKECTACGLPVDPDARFCGHCGFYLHPIPATQLAIDPEAAKKNASLPVTIEDIANARTLPQLKQMLYEPPGGDEAAPQSQRRQSAETVSLDATKRTESAGVPNKTNPATLDSRLGTRRFRRFPMRVDLGLYSAHNLFRARAENISAGGIFVATPKPAAIGEKLEVEFSLPGVEALCRARCVVRWVRIWGEAGTPVPGMGLEFVDLNPETAQSLAAFIAHRKPLDSPES